MRKRIISTKNAPAAVGPYSQAVEAAGLVFISGQIGLIPETGEFVKGGVKEQTEQVLNNMEAILKQAGICFEDVVKTTVLLSTMDDFSVVNAIYEKRFPVNPPARAAFAVASLPLNALVEIETIALSKSS